jgi:hypothetical protein
MHVELIKKKLKALIFLHNKSRQNRSTIHYTTSKYFVNYSQIMTLDRKYVYMLLVLVVNVAVSLTATEANQYIYSELYVSFLTLTCMNYVIASICCLLLLKRNAMKSLTRSLLVKMFPIAIVYCAHALFNHYSLSLNRPGTVQVIKYLCAPCVLVIYVFTQQLHFSVYTKTSLVLIFNRNIINSK